MKLPKNEEILTEKSNLEIKRKKLEHAAKDGQIGILKPFGEMYKNPNEIGVIPLINSIQNTHAEIFKMIFELLPEKNPKIDHDGYTGLGWTLLHVAALKGQKGEKFFKNFDCTNFNLLPSL